MIILDTHVLVWSQLQPGNFRGRLRLPFGERR